MRIFKIENIEDIIYFANWALEHQVDYIYVLEDLVRMLKGEQKSWSPEYYLD